MTAPFEIKLQSESLIQNLINLSSSFSLFAKWIGIRCVRLCSNGFVCTPCTFGGILAHCSAALHIAHDSSSTPKPVDCHSLNMPIGKRATPSIESLVAYNDINFIEFDKNIR